MDKKAVVHIHNGPTLCDPRDGSPPIPGILQARTLEWVAISFLPDPGIEPRSPALQALGLRGKAGGGARVTAGSCRDQEGRRGSAERTLAFSSEWRGLGNWAPSLLPPAPPRSGPKLVLIQGPFLRPFSLSQKHFGQWASGPSVPIIPWSLRGPRELIWEPWAWASRKWGRGCFKHHEKELLDPKD